jgi:sugar phosphate isomerase/epimerase
VELAPTKVWSQPLTVSDREVAEYRRFWDSHGIQIVAMQALLFGRPDLQVFGDASIQAATLAHVGGMCRMAQRLGARVLVFGSPKNRLRGDLDANTALRTATDFFRRLGDIAEQHNVLIGIESNPTVYGCDFLTTGIEAARFVEHVGHPAIALHLDTACLALSGESPGPLLRSYGRFVRHIHISEPRLQPIHASTLDHSMFSREIVGSGYGRWLSIEMQAPNGEFDERTLDESLAFVRKHYLSDRAALAA